MLQKAVLKISNYTPQETFAAGRKEGLSLSFHLLTIPKLRMLPILVHVKCQTFEVTMHDIANYIRGRWTGEHMGFPSPR